MKKILNVFLSVAFLLSPFAMVTPALAAGPATVNLLSAGNYVILSKTAITTTGATSITGDLGISPAFATAITGFALVLDGGGTFSTSALVNGNIYAADYAVPTPATLTTAVLDMQAAYTDAATRAPGVGATNLNVGGGTLSGNNFVPGTYTWGSNVTITGDITLTGTAADVWIFQITGNLSLDAGKQIILAGGALPENIFWQVAGTTTLFPGSVFNGIILAGPGASTIAMQNGAVLNGRALGQTDVTLIGNTVSAPTSTSCENLVTQTLVSDTTETIAVGDSPAISVTPHVAWTATIPGSTTWIWESSPTNPNETVAFEKTFTVSGTVLSAQLDIASDNNYQVFIDNVLIAADANLNNFQTATQDTHNLTVNVTPGLHTLRIEVTNSGAYNASSNPAGLLYKFTIVTCADQPDSSEVHGSKFFDINGNGTWDTGEPALSGWTINLIGTASGSQVTDGVGDYGFTNLAAGNYILFEVLQPGWTQTAAPGLITLGVGEVLSNQDFGNSCFVSTDGKSKGYWTNKNGQAQIDATDLEMLEDLNLVDAAGADFDLISNATLKTWLSKAKATNMAYMLSAQLAAVQLSVLHGFASSTAQVVATELLPFTAEITAGGGTISNLGIISIADLMTVANDALTDDNLTLSGDVNRAYQEALKNVLDGVATGQNIQICDVDLSITFTATDSSYYSGLTVSDPLYGTGPISFSWDFVTGNVTGGLWEEIVPPTSGTSYFNNVTSGTVSGTTVNLTFLRTLPAPYGPFTFTGTLVGGVLSGQAAGPYLLTATGVVTP